MESMTYIPQKRTIKIQLEKTQIDSSSFNLLLWRNTLIITNYRRKGFDSSFTSRSRFITEGSHGRSLGRKLRLLTLPHSAAPPRTPTHSLGRRAGATEMLMLAKSLPSSNLLDSPGHA